MTPAPEGSRWTVLRRRVCLAGRVTAVDGSASRGGRLSLAAAAPLPGGPTVLPGSPVVPPPDGPAVPARAWQAPIRPDGRYWFCDVPVGDYLVSGRDGRGRVVEARSVSVPAVDVREGRKPLLGVDLVAVDPAAAPAADDDG